MIRKNILFDFVFDNLLPVEMKVKPIFGMVAIYEGEKIMLPLGQRKNHYTSNGVRIVTTREFHKSLKEDLPSLRSKPALKNKMFETGLRL